VTTVGSGLRRGARAAGELWKELGGFGRVALVGMALSVIAAIVLGFVMSAAAGRHLLQVEMETYQSTVGEMHRRGLVPTGGLQSQRPADLDDAVRLYLLGGQTVRVRVWSPQAVLLYSDAGEQIGESFRLPGPAAAALATGEPQIDRADPSDPDLPEAGGERLMEFYVPVLDPNGEVASLVEIARRAELVEREARQARTGVWLMIGSGLGALSVFVGSLAIATVRTTSRRRRQAEQLLGDLLTGQDEERTRVVGALHDDIGQPLYRVLFGLQGSQARLGEDHPVRAELQYCQDLLRDVDASLRSELRLLRHGYAADLGLKAALEELAAANRRETTLTVGLDVGSLDREPGPVAGAALFRAAQEAVTNARKHARATVVRITAHADRSRVVLEIEDDGIGIGGPVGLGLTVTRERLEAIGGGLTVRSHRHRGTVLRAWVPSAEEAAP